MKTLKHFLMLCLFCMISIGASAEVYSGSCGDNAKWSLDTTTGLLSITGSGNMKDYSYSSVPWYSYRSSIKSVSIGNQITSVGNYAFYYCSGLTSVTIGNSVTSIGDWAFEDCSSLTSVTIPNSVTSIGDGAFWYCSGLTSVTIGNSVTLIGHQAFNYCRSLSSVVVQSGNAKYDSRNNCNAIIETATNTLIAGSNNAKIPNNVVKITSTAFQGSGLTSIEIPASVTLIQNGAFKQCENLTSVVVSSGNTKYDSRNNCNAIIETATNTLITGCITTIIPNSVTSIGRSAFDGCSGLTSVTIPESVKTIGERAFEYCSGLTSVYVEWKDADKIPVLTSSWDFPYSTCDLYVPIGTKTIYPNKSWWGSFQNIYEYGLESLLLGDANDDGSVNVNDITTIATYILNGKVAPWNEKNADANEDGSINVNDITATATIILNPINPGREELITNGNMESDDVRCFFTIEPSTGGPHPAVIVEGEGYDGSRCIKLVSADGASQDDWATEFFIKLLRPLAVGTKLHVEFDYKSDKEAASDTQCHSTPGNYLHWQCIGNPTWQPNWQHFSADITTDASMTDAFQTIAFNLAKNKVQTTFWIDNIVVYTEVNEGSSDQLLGEQIENGDLEGDNVSNFFVTEPATGPVHAPTIFDGVGVNGSRGIKVVSANGASQDDWATQFFIRVPKAIKVGTKIKVSFDYRASIESDADTQTHSTPGNYIHWTCIGSPHFTTNWQHFEYEGTTSGDMTDNFQTIAFNLAKNKVQTEYYFDNISFVVEK